MSSASPAATTHEGFTEASFNEFLSSRDEPSWLIDRRREAFARYQSFAWPSARDEEWRRTDLRALKLADFSPPRTAEPSSEARAALDPLWQSLSSHYATGIQHVNGVCVKSADAGRLGGAVFLDLATAVQEQPELLRRWLSTEAVTPASDIFAALHAAFWSGGHPALRAPRGEGARSLLQPVGD